VTSLKQQAIRLLARREHTHAELQKKLAGEGTVEEIAAVLADLSANGLLSDQRTAASYLRSHGARFGAAKLRQTLRAKGADDETIASAIEAADMPDEMERARAIWLRKFREPPQNQSDWARQARFLQSRGFSSDVIRRLLKEQKDQD
jgi:regulatory protein